MISNAESVKETCGHPKGSRISPGAAAATTLCGLALETSSTSGVGVAIEGEVESTCPVVGCKWASWPRHKVSSTPRCWQSHAQRTFRKMVSRTPRSASKLASTVALCKVALEEGCRMCPLALGKSGAIARTTKPLVHALAQHKSMMAIFAFSTPQWLGVRPQEQCNGNRTKWNAEGFVRTVSRISPRQQQIDRETAIPGWFQFQSATRARIELMASALRVTDRVVAFCSRRVPWQRSHPRRPSCSIVHMRKHVPQALVQCDRPRFELNVCQVPRFLNLPSGVPQRSNHQALVEQQLFADHVKLQQDEVMLADCSSYTSSARSCDHHD